MPSLDTTQEYLMRLCNIVSSCQITNIFGLDKSLREAMRYNRFHITAGTVLTMVPRYTFNDPFTSLGHHGKASGRHLP